MIIFADTETTGLDEKAGHLLEVALVVTDDLLNEVAHTSVVVRPVPRAVPFEVHPVVQAMHEENGLWADVESIGIRLYEAEQYLCDFTFETFAKLLDDEDVKLSQTPLAGSTIGFDRRWLHEHMPNLEKLFHYRSIDVSSFTEMAKRWAPEVYKNRPKSDARAAHRALPDTRESIAYLKYFRWSGFINAPTVG